VLAAQHREQQQQNSFKAFQTRSTTQVEQNQKEQARAQASQESAKQQQQQQVRHIIIQVPQQQFVPEKRTAAPAKEKENKPEVRHIIEDRRPDSRFAKNEKHEDEDELKTKTIASSSTQKSSSGGGGSSSQKGGAQGSNSNHSGHGQMANSNYAGNGVNYPPPNPYMNSSMLNDPTGQQQQQPIFIPPSLTITNSQHSNDDDHSTQHYTNQQNASHSPPQGTHGSATTRDTSQSAQQGSGSHSGPKLDRNAASPAAAADQKNHGFPTAPSELGKSLGVKDTTPPNSGFVRVADNSPFSDTMNDAGPGYSVPAPARPTRTDALPSTPTSNSDNLGTDPFGRKYTGTPQRSDALTGGGIHIQASDIPTDIRGVARPAKPEALERYAENQVNPATGGKIISDASPYAKSISSDPGVTSFVTPRYNLGAQYNAAPVEVAPAARQPVAIPSHADNVLAEPRPAPQGIREQQSLPSEVTRPVVASPQTRELPSSNPTTAPRTDLQSEPVSLPAHNTTVHDGGSGLVDPRPATPQSVREQQSLPAEVTHSAVATPPQTRELPSSNQPTTGRLDNQGQPVSTPTSADHGGVVDSRPATPQGVREQQSLPGEVTHAAVPTPPQTRELPSSNQPTTGRLDNQGQPVSTPTSADHGGVVDSRPATPQGVRDAQSLPGEVTRPAVFTPPQTRELPSQAPSGTPNDVSTPSHSNPAQHNSFNPGDPSGAPTSSTTGHSDGSGMPTSTPASTHPNNSDIIGGVGIAPHGTPTTNPLLSDVGSGTNPQQQNGFNPNAGGNPLQQGGSFNSADGSAHNFNNSGQGDPAAAIAAHSSAAQQAASGQFVANGSEKPWAVGEASVPATPPNNTQVPSSFTTPPNGISPVSFTGDHTGLTGFNQQAGGSPFNPVMGRPLTDQEMANLSAAMQLGSQFSNFNPILAMLGGSHNGQNTPQATAPEQAAKADGVRDLIQQMANATNIDLKQLVQADTPLNHAQQALVNSLKQFGEAGEAAAQITHLLEKLAGQTHETTANANSISALDHVQNQYHRLEDFATTRREPLELAFSQILPHDRRGQEMDTLSDVTRSYSHDPISGITNWVHSSFPDASFVQQQIQQLQEQFANPFEQLWQHNQLLGSGGGTGNVNGYSNGSGISFADLLACTNSSGITFADFLAANGNGVSFADFMNATGNNTTGYQDPFAATVLGMMPHLRADWDPFENRVNEARSLDPTHHHHHGDLKHGEIDRNEIDKSDIDRITDAFLAPFAAYAGNPYDEEIAARIDRQLLDHQAIDSEQQLMEQQRQLELQRQLEGRKMFETSRNQELIDQQRQQQQQQRLLDQQRQQQQQQQQQQQKEEELIRADNYQAKYVVRPHDTLQSIAAKKLGSVDLWELIYELNKNKIPVKMNLGQKIFQLLPGTTLFLPSRKQVRDWKRRRLSHQANDRQGLRMSSDNDQHDPDRRANVENLLGPLKTVHIPSYTVRLGDTLRSVAMKHPAINDVKLWKLLALKNSLPTTCDSKGMPTATLRRGTKLNLPTPKEVFEYRKEQLNQTAPDNVQAQGTVVELVSKECPGCRRLVTQSCSVCPACATQIEPQVNTESLDTVITGNTRLPGRSAPLPDLYQPTTTPEPGQFDTARLNSEESMLTTTPNFSDSEDTYSFDSRKSSDYSSSRSRQEVVLQKREDLLAENCRLIHAEVDRGGTSIERSQLEVLKNDRWHVILLYELSNEGSSRQEALPTGKMWSIKIDLPLPLAQEMVNNDLTSNWMTYCKKFLAGKRLSA